MIPPRRSSVIDMGGNAQNPWRAELGPCPPRAWKRSRTRDRDRRSGAGFAGLCGLGAALVACAAPFAGGPATPAAVVREAAELSTAGRSGEAADRLRRAVAQGERDLALVRAWVEAEFKAGRIDGVRREIQARVVAAPADDVLHYALGLAMFATTASAGEPAVKHLAEAARLRPEVAEYHFRLGVARLEAEQYALARPSLQRGVELAPANPRHYLPFAMCLTRTGDRKGAIGAIARLIELEPDPRDVELAGRVMRRLTDPFREVPKSVQADFERGLELLSRADAPQQALVVFAEILDKYPDLAAAHALVGVCHHRLDNAGAAVDAYRRAVELAPDDARTYVYLGDLYFARERYDAAKEAYEKAVARDPLEAAAYARLGEIALARADATDAARWYRVLVRLRRDDVPARISFARALQGLGEFSPAERELEAAVKNGPSNADAWLRLGLLHEEQLHRSTDPAEREARQKKAAAAYRRVLDLQPENLIAPGRLKALGP